MQPILAEIYLLMPLSNDTFMNETDIRVSIVCNCFNHGPYLRDALNGFVEQITTFPFEVLIHDDASTDESVEIIKEYQKKYPDLIKPIFEKENQYSKGIKIFVTFQLPRAKGEYIAFCEGDDFWTDRFKLQKQFELMECNPDVNICAHSNTWLNCINGKKKTIQRENRTCIISTSDVILGGGDFVATSSIFIRKKVYSNPPPFFSINSMDYSTQVLGSLKSGMLYLPDNMSTYRYMSSESWSKKMKKNNSLRVQHVIQWEKMLEQLDFDSGYKYAKEIGQRILLSCVSPSCSRSHNVALIKKNKSCYHELQKKQRIKISFIAHFPITYRFLQRIRNFSRSKKCLKH